MAPSEHQAQGERIGYAFIDAFNQRDADALVALSHPDIEFRPTMLVGSRRVYKGHDGLRDWVAELVAADAKHKARVREIRVLDNRLIVLTEVLLDSEVMSPSAMVATLLEGKIVNAQAYLSDEALLTELDLLR